jgi:NAD(P)-dependent dehydrogenase (short-subunit alcohol dehydrogenase family)
MTDIASPRSMLTGKVALVTGGSKGIGLAVARRLARDGARVLITSRRESNLRAAVEGSPDLDLSWFVSNAGDPEQIRASVATCIERLGPVDILVNNAATNPYHGPIEGIDVERATKTLAVNLTGPMLWSQAVWSASMSERGGSIVNIASVGGVTVEDHIGWYNTTKAGLLQLTRQLAYEFAPQVRVNAVAPGLVRTDLARALWEESGDEFAKTLPLRRLGEPEDISAAVAFLVSDEASWITGHTLVVDGGSLVRPSPGL